MAALSQKITGKVAGDSLRIERTYTGLPAAETIIKAYITIKEKISDPDPGKKQKSITQTGTADGQITDAATPDVSLRFDFTPTETLIFKPGREYLYDVQMHSSDTDIFTGEVGTIIFERGVTQATS